MQSNRTDPTTLDDLRLQLAKKRELYKIIGLHRNFFVKLNESELLRLDIMRLQKRIARMEAEVPQQDAAHHPA